MVVGLILTCIIRDGLGILKLKGRETYYGKGVRAREVLQLFTFVFCMHEPIS